MLTTVANTKAAGEPVDISIIPPGRNVNEEISRVSYGEAKRESVYLRVWKSEMEKIDTMRGKGDHHQ